jgi:hypothetical protein
MLRVLGAASTAGRPSFLHQEITLSITSQIAALEQQITGLADKIAERERNHAASGGETFSGKDGGAKRWNGEHFRHTEAFTTAHRAQLRALQCDLITLRLHGGGWEPAEIIKRMSTPNRSE